jgi:hypothetical protein
LSAVSICGVCGVVHGTTPKFRVSGLRMGRHKIVRVFYREGLVHTVGVTRIPAGTLFCSQVFAVCPGPCIHTPGLDHDRLLSLATEFGHYAARKVGGVRDPMR